MNSRRRNIRAKYFSGSAAPHTPSGNPHLALCRDCSASVSRTAPTCPHCGAENPTQNRTVVHLDRLGRETSKAGKNLMGLGCAIILLVGLAVVLFAVLAHGEARDAAAITLKELHRRAYAAMKNDVTEIQRKAVRAALIGRTLVARGAVIAVSEEGSVCIEYTSSGKVPARVKTRKNPNRKVPRLTGWVNLTMPTDVAVKLKKGQKISITGRIANYQCQGSGGSGGSPDIQVWLEALEESRSQTP